jgi:hypothetical protein
MGLEAYFDDIKQHHGWVMKLYLGMLGVASLLLLFATLVLVSLALSQPTIELTVSDYGSIVFVLVMIMVYGTVGFYIYGVWKWQRWGVYGLFVSHIASTLYLYSAGISISFVTMTSLFLFWWLVRRKWAFYQ